MLTLNERTYLMDILKKYFPERTGDDLYELTGAFTTGQRARFLALYFKKDHSEAKEMANQILSFQTRLL